MMKCLIIILRFPKRFAPCILKATAKRTTKALRILPPTFKPVSQQIKFCKLRKYWILIGKNYPGVALYVGVTVHHLL